MTVPSRPLAVDASRDADLSVDVAFARAGDRAAAARFYDATAAHAWRLALLVHGGCRDNARAATLTAYEAMFRPLDSAGVGSAGVDSDPVASAPGTGPSPTHALLGHIRASSRDGRAA